MHLNYNDYSYMYSATPEAQFMTKISNTETEFKKSVAYKKSVYYNCPQCKNLIKLHFVCTQFYLQQSRIQCPVISLCSQCHYNVHISEDVNAYIR